MTAEEYFGDWMKVIDENALVKVMQWLKTTDSNLLCPQLPNVFKAFRICPYNECKVVFLGQDPYPQAGVATGILFGNSLDTSEEFLSPSLQIIKEAAIDYTIPHNVIEFDNSLESWAKQGILMINTALTCYVNQVGIHYAIWKDFMSKLLYNMSSKNDGIIYVLFGNQAMSFKDSIAGHQHILTEYHPAYYARRGDKMSPLLFKEINRIFKGMYNKELEFYKETDYGTC